jgi:hypothetical protein
MVVELLKIEVGSEYRCESGRSSDPADYREIPYIEIQKRRVQATIIYLGMISFCWTSMLIFPPVTSLDMTGRAIFYINLGVAQKRHLKRSAKLG